MQLAPCHWCSALEHGWHLQHGLGQCKGVGVGGGGGVGVHEGWTVSHGTQEGHPSLQVSGCGKPPTPSSTQSSTAHNQHIRATDGLLVSRAEERGRGQCARTAKTVGGSLQLSVQWGLLDPPNCPPITHTHTHTSLPSPASPASTPSMDAVSSSAVHRAVPTGDLMVRLVEAGVWRVVANFWAPPSPTLPFFYFAALALQ